MQATKEMVTFALSRIVLYVQDVQRLCEFYRTIFGFPVIEEIKGEWVVLAAGRL